jgi:predicted membrane protein
MLARAYASLMTLLVTVMTVFAIATPALAACGDPVLGIPPWHRGLTDAATCEIKPIGEQAGQTSLTKFIWTVALNIVQTLLVVVAYVTIFFIIKGGFNYMTSMGESSSMANAKTTIKNAVIGLIVALLSASIVNAITGAIK